MPEWWNWQTQRSQKPWRKLGGSTPPLGTVEYSRTGLPDMSSLIGQKDWSSSRLHKKVTASLQQSTCLAVGERIRKPAVIYLVLTHKWWCTAFVTLNRVSSILTRTSKCRCRIMVITFGFQPEDRSSILRICSTALSSIGQDIWFSSIKVGFDSRQGYKRGYSEIGITIDLHSIIPSSNLGSSTKKVQQ